MADLTQLRALQERVRAATGPDRELDAEIMFDFFAAPVGKHKEGGPIGYIRLDDQPSWNIGIRFPGKDRDWFAATRKQIKGETLVIERDGAHVLMNSIRIPEYTASIDATMALTQRLLPGARINGSFGPDYSHAWLVRGWGARAQHFPSSQERDDDQHALTILDALLTALIAQGGNPDV